MIGPLALLPGYKAQVAIALTCGDGELLHRNIRSCAVGGSGKRQVRVRNHVQTCAPARTLRVANNARVERNSQRTSGERGGIFG